MPFAKESKFTEKQVLQNIKNELARDPSIRNTVESHHSPDSIWFRVARSLLRGEKHKFATILSLSFRLFSKYAKNDRVRRLLLSPQKATRKKGKQEKTDVDRDSSEHENETPNPSAESDTQEGTHQDHELYCICHTENDDSPYVRCDNCREWYHFRCIGFSTAPSKTTKVKDEPYVCNSCSSPAVRGIVNIGNTCWFSYTMQAMNKTHVGHMMKAVSSSAELFSQCYNTIRRILCSLNEPVNAPLDEGVVAEAVRVISNEIGGAFRNTTRQQDASEFYSQCVSRCITEKNQIDDTDLVTTLVTTKTTTCMHCGQTDITQEPLPILTVTPDGSTVTENISRLLQTEVRSGIHCQQCNRKRDKRYTYAINRLPPCLVLLVNRSRRMGRKNKTPITSVLRVSLSEMDIDLDCGMTVPLEYNMVSSVVHHGEDSRSGHYVSYTYDGISFTQYDDETASEYQLNNAVDDITKNGTLLFYHLTPFVTNDRVDGTKEDVIDDELLYSDHDDGEQNNERASSPDMYAFIYENDEDEYESGTSNANITEDHGHQTDSTRHTETLMDDTITAMGTSPVYKKFFEADIPRRAQFTVDNEKWEQLRQKQVNTTLPLQWVNVFYGLLKTSNPYCTLMFRRHRAAKKNSRKRPEKIFSAEAYCAHKPSCTVTAFVTVNDDLTGEVVYEGSVRHRTDHTSQRPVRADEREKLKDQLWSEHCPSRIHNERLGKMDPKSYASGNFTGVGIDGTVFKQISSEGRRRLRSDSDLFTSMLLKQMGPLADYIRQISIFPRFTIAFTEAGIRLFHDLASTVPLHWDATGSVAWKEGGKQYLYYSIIMPNPKKQAAKESSSPCPITELVTDNQSEPTISHWLEVFRYQEKKIFGHRNTTTPCLISSDRSLPLLIASLKVFTMETLLDYMERSWRIVDGKASAKELNKMIIHSGLSHFMKDAKEMCKKHYRKEQSWFAMKVFRLLAAVSTLKELRELLLSMCIVFRAERKTTLYRDHKKQIIGSFQKKIHDETPENDQDETDEDKKPSMDKIAECTEENAFLQQQSNFKTLAELTDEKAQAMISRERATLREEWLNLPVNSFRGNNLLDNIKRYMLPTVPIWSNLLLGDLTRHCKMYTKYNYDRSRFFIQNPPTTQGYMEAYNKILKTSTLANFKYRLDELIEKMHQGVIAHQRKFLLQHKIKRKKRAGKKSSSLIKEKWKRTSTRVKTEMRKRSAKGVVHRMLSKKRQPKTKRVGSKSRREVSSKKKNIPNDFRKTTDGRKEAKRGIDKKSSTDREAPMTFNSKVKGKPKEQPSQQGKNFDKEKPGTSKTRQASSGRGLSSNQSTGESEEKHDTYIIDSDDDGIITGREALDKYESLLRNNWLNDIVVNDYFDFLQMQDVDFNIFVCNSFQTNSTVKEDAVIRKWYRHQKLTNSKWVLLPYNEDNVHWLLLAANLVSKKLYYLDPLRDVTTGENIDKFRRFLEKRSAFEGKPLVCKQWKVVSTSVAKFPFQTNSYDCGLLTLLYARALILDERIDGRINLEEQRLRLYNELHDYDLEHA